MRVLEKLSLDASIDENKIVMKYWYICFYHTLYSSIMCIFKYVNIYIYIYIYIYIWY